MWSRAPLVTIALLSVLAAANCTGPNSESLVAPDQLELIQSTCEIVMHIRNGVDLEACTRSLSDTVVALRKEDAVRHAEADCARRGVPRGTSAFAMCALDNRHVDFPSPTAPPVLAYNPQRDSPEGYYNASFDTKRRREEIACAQLGIAVESDAFGDCVADLDAGLFHADNPYR